MGMVLEIVTLRFIRSFVVRSHLTYSLDSSWWGCKFDWCCAALLKKKRGKWKGDG